MALDVGVEARGARPVFDGMPKSRGGWRSYEQQGSRRGARFGAGLGASEVEEVVFLTVRLAGEVREVAPSVCAVTAAPVIVGEAG